MSLNWSTEKVKYFADNPDELWVMYGVEGTASAYEDVNAETKALIFGSMSIGLNCITEANAAEWYARWKIYEKYSDFCLYTKFIDGVIRKTFLTVDVLVKHTYLSTNANNETTTEWTKRFVRQNNALEGYKVTNPTSAQIKAMITVYKMEYDELLEEQNILNSMSDDERSVYL